MKLRFWCAGLVVVAGALQTGSATAQPTPPSLPVPTIQIPSIQVGTFEVRDITLGSPDKGAVKIARITFKGFARGTDAVRANTVEFEAISGQFGSRKLEIPAINVSGFEVPTDLFRALTEGGGGSLDLDWPALLQKATVRELTIDTAMEERQDPQIKVTYSGVSLKNLVNGFLEGARIDRVSGTGGAAGSPIAVSSGAIEYQGIDLPEMVRFATGGVAGEPKPLLQRASASDFDLKTGDVAITIKKIEQLGLDGRAPVLGPPEPGIVMPGVSPPASPKRMAQYAQSLAKTLRVGRYSLEGLRIVASSEGVTVEVGAVSVGGLSSRAIEHLEVRDVAVTSSVGNGKLDRFVLERLSFGNLLDLALAAAAEGRTPDINPDKLGDATPRLGLMRLTRLEMETPIGPITLGEFRTEVDDADAVVPERMTMALSGFKMDASQAEKSQGTGTLAGLGYSELSGDLQIEARWRQQERALTVENSRLVVDNVGRVDLGLRLGNLDVPVGTTDAALIEAALTKAGLESLTIRLSNLGLAERLYAQMAQGSGVPPEQFRQRLAANFNVQAAMMVGPALAPGSAEAIAAFLRSPGRIVARATPRPGAPPLTISSLEGVSLPDILQRITIKIEIPQN